jgi:hypothetical protein
VSVIEQEPAIVDDLSIRELQLMLDGGGEDDWIAIVKVRPEKNGARIRVQRVTGELIQELFVVAGDELKVTYTMQVHA